MTCHIHNMHTYRRFTLSSPSILLERYFLLCALNVSIDSICLRPSPSPSSSETSLGVFLNCAGDVTSCPSSLGCLLTIFCVLGNLLIIPSLKFLALVGGVPSLWLRARVLRLELADTRRSALMVVTDWMILRRSAPSVMLRESAEEGGGGGNHVIPFSINGRILITQRFGIQLQQ